MEKYKYVIEMLERIKDTKQDFIDHYGIDFIENKTKSEEIAEINEVIKILKEYK